MTDSGQQFSQFSTYLREELRRLFNLQNDTDYEATLNQIKTGVDFKSGNLWALIFAILIASVGLNVNSTAVIIGAMLVSPLMGPIMGIGLALGVNDLELFRRAVRNLAIAAAVSILTSMLYFLLSPLAEVQSELLARTRPTIYDVLIAIFGGAAGMVALSRKGDKGNVLPGVAIATALMPPLCTAGFGLATLNADFFFGALHLFLINALFICLATLGFTRLLRFKRIAYLEPHRARRIRLIIAIITTATVVPSVIVALNVINETRFESSARRFAAENLVFRDRTVLKLDLNYSKSKPSIDVTVMGPPLSPESIEMLEKRLPAYGLAATKLNLRQPASSQLPVDQLSRMVRQGILEDLYKRNERAIAARDERIRVLEDEVVRLRGNEIALPELAGELAAIYPGLLNLGLGQGLDVRAKAAKPRATVTATWSRKPAAAERTRLLAYLKLRLKNEEVRLINATQT